MIRKKYFVPFSLVIVVLIAFRLFLFEPIVKIVIQSSLSAIPKVDVSIKKLNLSIIHGQLSLSDLLVVYDEANDNVSIKDVKLDIDMNNLLKGKFVVDKMLIAGVSFINNDIEIASDGIQDEDKSAKSSKVAGMADGVLSYYSAESISKRLELDSILDLSKAKLEKVLSEELVAIQSSYNVLQEVLEDESLDKEFKQLEIAIKEKEQNQPSDFTKLPQYLQELAELKEQYDKVQLEYSKKEAAIRGFENRAAWANKKVNKAAKADMGAIDSKLRKIDAKQQSFTADLIGVQIGKYLGIADKAIAILKTFKKDKADVPVHKFKGIDVSFPIEDSYPAFYIKDIEILGVDKNDRPFSGGAKDITNKQSVRGVPTRFEFAQNLGRSVSFIGSTVDLREGVDILVDGFMQNQDLKNAYWDSSQIPLKIDKGTYDFSVDAGYSDDKLIAKVGVETDGLKMSFFPAIEERSLVERYLFESVRSIPKFSLKIDINGDKLSVDSSIDKMMQIAHQSLIDSEVKKVKAKYDSEWQSYVKDQLNSFSESVNSLALQ